MATVATPRAPLHAHLGDAESAARRAAGRAGVTVVELTAVEDLKQVAQLFASIWATGDDRPPLSSDVLRAFSHNGNYVAGARDADGRIVGASAGFLALVDGVLKLHSHITGIAIGVQGRSIGTALKQHQRVWALERGIDSISWTFDPLVRRNAWFNLVKLGAAITAYHPHFYGAMEDGVNSGDESDRCVVEWRLTDAAARRAAHGTLVAVDSDVLLDDGGSVALASAADGRPLARDADGKTTLLCWVPEDIVALRQRDPAVALAWRRALRDAFTSAVDAGLAATAMTRDGYYVLAPPSTR